MTGSLLVPGIRFGSKDLKERNVVISRGGQPVELTELKEGDVISAEIITKAPPATMTQTEYEVYVRNQPKPRPRPARVASARPASRPATLPKTGSRLPLLGLAGLIALGVGAGLSLRRMLISG